MTVFVPQEPPFAAHLLPRESTPLEKALAAVDDRILDIPIPLRALWHWDECPAAQLPWLAWALRVDLWDETWSDTKKREVIRRSFALHRLKGTLAGQRDYISLAGSELYRWVRPPAKNFLGRSSTLEERVALLEKMPQIRIFPARRTANAGFRGFWNGRHGPWFEDASGRPDCFPREVDPHAKITTRAIYIYGNVTKELTWAALSDTGEQVMIPSTARQAVFTSSITGRGVFRKSDAKDRIITLNLDRTSAIDQLLYRFPVVPKLTTINVVPARVGEHGFAPRSVLCGTPISASNRIVFDGPAPQPLPPLPNGTSHDGKRYFVPSGAKYRTFDVVYFKDPNLGLEGRTTAQNFMGHQRFGIPNFTAEFKVVVPGKRPKWVADRFVGGILWRAPKDNLNNALTASRVAKSARDTILFNTAVARPLKIGTPLLLGGELILGQYTRS